MHWIPCHFSFSQQSAYICNFRDHWFTVRKLGYQWFNLNSLLTGPELISDTYLSLFLTQLQQEGKMDVWGWGMLSLTGPELISDTYLSLFLTQLQQEGKMDVWGGGGGVLVTLTGLELISDTSIHICLFSSPSYSRKVKWTSWGGGGGGMFSLTGPELISDTYLSLFLTQL